MRNKNTITGISLAVLATFIWAGNFIIARGVHDKIPPVSLAFYRWLLATLIMLPITWNRFKVEWVAVKRSTWYLLAVGITGVSMFNTFVYVGGHYTSAINLSLIGTTSSPIISVALAAIFLREKIGWMKLVGMIICISGVLYLLSEGNPEKLSSFQFTKGDTWVLLAALVFSIYNTLVKRKPAAISPINFLFVVFAAGTILLFPFYVWEIMHSAPVAWTINLVLIILYLGIGASVICFMIWNMAIHKLGAGTTALFGNLIPVFATLEAVLILNEQITWIHVISFSLVIIGLLIANYTTIFNKDRL
ncbi:MAG TPA: DMT family transporter [Chitinophagaceae bacterium]|nr:DMT family transporter [Chitinophagaceae bacterium]